MYTVGLDIGASSVKVVAVPCSQADRVNQLLMYRAMKEHKGNPARCLADMLEQMLQQLPAEECAGWASTGQEHHVLGEKGLNLEEVPAITLGASLLAPQVRSIIEIGGQQGIFIADVGSKGAPRFSMNDGCAAGTGAFFEDQMQRLDMHIEQYSSVVEKAKSIPRLSGRCAVFAKTDIIHRQQEGVPTPDILLGLCYAMVRSFKALIVRGLPVEKPVALSGGILLNKGVVRAVREVFELKPNELLCGQENLYFQATGAALYAAEKASFTSPKKVSPEGISFASAVSPASPVSLSALKEALLHPQVEPLERLDALPHTSYRPGIGYRIKSEPLKTNKQGMIPCTLGIDVGSTSTNVVALDQDGDILDAQYLRTRGNPCKSVADGLASLGKRMGDRLQVMAVATTGSGRTMIGKYVGADLVRDEITAQARAAAAADPNVDTVFEIGGQDSKFISLHNGNVVDFQMNKICAAGTGSFIEEQAARLGIPLSEYGQLALSSKSPVDLGERCTVFVETAINAALAAGADKRDIAAGLCQSIVRNYLHRVVASKHVGTRIVLQGGVNYNEGIVAAFKQAYGDRVTVSPWFAVSGAVGAALLAWESVPARTIFRGFDLSGAPTSAHTKSDAEIERNRKFFHDGEDLMLDGYTGAIDPKKKTVGVPRCLMIYKFFPMAYTFFSQLGFNVRLSDMSDEETVRQAQRTAQGETCFPVKLIYGHMQQLADQGVDYIFMPRIHTIKHTKTHVAHNYGCPYMHTAPKLVAGSLKLADRGIKLLSPLFDLDFGQPAMATAMLGVGEQLGCDPHETARALLAGSYAVTEFTRKTEEAGDRLLKSLKPGERVLVMVTRNYGISDAVLNSGIPDILIDHGEKVITISNLHAHGLDISQDYPNMYWPFGQHILSSAKIIRRDPRLFAVYLTNHGCGPDTMLSHLVAEEMGDKPYLQIEVDEHASKVGIITRIEAFLNSIDHYQASDERNLPMSVKTIDQNDRPLDPKANVLMPGFGVVSDMVASVLRNKGVHTTVIPMTPQVIERGKKFSITKEYLTFSATMGAAIEASQHTEAVGATKTSDGSLKSESTETSDTHSSSASTDSTPEQLLLLSNEGAEADGQYDRVIESILSATANESDAKDMTDVAKSPATKSPTIKPRATKRQLRLVAPRAEQLPDWAPDPDALFNALLAADVVFAAPRDMRSELRKRLEDAGCAFDVVLEAASQVGNAAAHGAAAAQEKQDSLTQSTSKRVFALGEWPVVWDDCLNSDVLNHLEQQGFQILRMPVSEYFLFLWADSYDADRLHGMHERMDAVRQALGLASAFADDFDGLRKTADDLVGNLHAANARYRAAKTQLAAGKADGVLALASMYENTDIILQLAEGIHRPPCPVMHLTFDGVLDASIDDKVRSFVYYL